MKLPNVLTIVRIFFVPLLVAALVEENVSVRLFGVVATHEWLALAIFLVAAATDLLDGYLARRWGQVTTIGTLLDPIADKLLVSAALISLVQVHAVPAWMVIVIVGREFAISGLRSIAAAEGYTIRASDLGKTKMVAQVTAVSLLLVGLHHPKIAWMGYWMMWIVVAFAMLSAVGYFRKFWRKVDIRIKSRRRRELLRMERKRKMAPLRRQGRSSPAEGPSEVGGVRGTT
ncbi:MAG: CDP-diacylglycerol--glycerol-3-phosphate 3-phosphatidyltransferase [Acidobacteria bacterium]|nr:MAG: CDP-diacylglycerol--glycerol-3-phosphate 3-phosphatidyltransferase [Acidobacteriota bacterium]